MTGLEDQERQRNERFRSDCLKLIRRDGYRISETTCIFRRDEWKLSLFSGFLSFRNETVLDDENVILVWSDLRGGKLVDDLTPYESLLNKWMILDRLSSV